MKREEVRRKIRLLRLNRSKSESNDRLPFQTRTSSIDRRRHLWTPSRTNQLRSMRDSCEKSSLTRNSDSGNDLDESRCET